MTKTADHEQKFFDWTSLLHDKKVYQKRRDNCCRLLEEKGGIFLIPSRHGMDHDTFRQNDDFLYFTGLELPDSMLALDVNSKEAIMFVPARDERFENPDRINDFPGRPLGEDKMIPGISGINDFRPFSTLTDAVKAWISDGQTIYINLEKQGSITSYQTDYIANWTKGEQLLFHLQNNFSGIKLENGYPTMARLRMVKGVEEIEAMRRVSNITQEAIIVAASHVTAGIDEFSLAGILEAEYKKRGGQRVAFTSIIKSGPNSMWAWRILASHYNRRNRVMRNGEVVVFDVGTELDYYTSDMGRTFPISGKFTSKQREKLEMITQTSDAVIAAVKPGTTLLELNQVARDNSPEKEHKYMQTPSYLGHHIGLCSGDPSLLEATLKPGMIFTIEPWYYNHDEQVAVFVEDNLLVTEDGVDVLTANLPRDPSVLEKMVKSY
jgi:Xaa-Pro aminopeptidase